MSKSSDKTIEKASIGVMRGKVVSVKMKDTAVVLVNRFVKHPKYRKYMTISKKYKVHDPSNTLKEGETVQIVECKPISKDKHFRVIKDGNIKM